MLGFKNFLLDEEGVGVVELILIVVVLIALVVLFKNKLTTLVTNIFDTITERAGEV
jgi:Flp pilus assembly pilin Flp